MASLPPSETWLTGATVVDGTGRDPVERLDIHVVGGQIAALGTAPPGAPAIDVSGATVTPGLIDAHVHLGVASPIDKLMSHQLSVAEIASDIFRNVEQTLDAGFTTVRDCGGIDGGVAHTVAIGKVMGPRILPCGPIQCQTGGHGHFAAEWEPTSLWPTHAVPGLAQFAMLSDGPEQMRKNIRETFRRGATFIKMCVSGGVISSHDELTNTQFTVEEIAVAVEEAAARGTYVTVHSHNNAGVRNAVRAGVRCIEHGSAIDEETAALMAEHDVAHVPTLSIIDQLAKDATSSGLPEAMADRSAAVQQGQLDGVRASRAAGVRVGLGSDLLGPDQTARAGELVLRSALESPMLALVSATQTNAEILGLGDQVGTVEVGKRADLVAWRTNPLDKPATFADRTNAMVVVQSGRIVKDLR